VTATACRVDDFGATRLSAHEQRLDAPLAALTQAGWIEVFADADMPQAAYSLAMGFEVSARSRPRASSLQAAAIAVFRT
jgi:hypothetical protein